MSRVDPGCRLTEPVSVETEFLDVPAPEHEPKAFQFFVFPDQFDPFEKFFLRNEFKEIVSRKVLRNDIAEQLPDHVPHRFLEAMVRRLPGVLDIVVMLEDGIRGCPDGRHRIGGPDGELGFLNVPRNRIHEGVNILGDRFPVGRRRFTHQREMPSLPDFNSQVVAHQRPGFPGNRLNRGAPLLQKICGFVEQREERFEPFAGFRFVLIVKDLDFTFEKEKIAVLRDNLGRRSCETVIEVAPPAGFGGADDEPGKTLCQIGEQPVGGLEDPDRRRYGKSLEEIPKAFADKRLERVPFFVLDDPGSGW